MTKEIIALFSSDARDLYKADVYRALALPEGYVLHFRYAKGHIHSDIWPILGSEVKGQEGAIFFVTGNDSSIPEGERKVAFHSIRSVTILGVEVDQTIDAVHFYLELGKFVDATPQQTDSTEIHPQQLPLPKAFVSKIKVATGLKHQWSERVDAVKSQFPGRPFFYVESVRKNKDRLSPEYSSPDRASSYALDEESHYQVDVVTYDPGNGQTGLSAENGSSDVELKIQSGYRIGATRDRTTLRLQTHTLSRQKSTTYTRFLGVNYATVEPSVKDADYRVVLEWTVRRKRSKAIWFGALSVLAALGIGLAKVATDDLGGLHLSCLNALLGAVSLVCVGLSSAFFYSEFNKK